jgi:hypothetical protein
MASLKLAITGAEGIKTATGKDYFPEFTSMYRQWALNQIYQQTPDINDSYQWGDEDNERSLYNFHRVALNAMLSGVNGADPQVGPMLHELTEELVTANEDGQATSPMVRFFLFYDPDSPRVDWRTVLPGGMFSSGPGMLWVHNGWGASDSFFGAHMSPTTGCDHEVEYFGNFQLYRHGEWGITKPIGYGCDIVNDSGWVNNSMVLAGLGSMQEARGPIAQEFGPNGAYTYLAGSTGGQFVSPGYYNPPPTYLHEWTRSMLYLPSVDKHSDTIVVFDRTNADDPQKIGGFSLYGSDVQASIKAAPALKQWVIHSPVKPTVGTNLLSWATPGGQQVQVQTLFPTTTKVTTYNEANISNFPGYVNSSELKWQARIMPTTSQKWDTFLNVVQVYDSGTALTNLPVQSFGGEVQGAVIQRAGNNDALVLFSAQPGPTIPATSPDPNGLAVFNPNMMNLVSAVRIMSHGYSAAFTTSTDKTDVYLADLDTTKTWYALVRTDAGYAMNVMLVPVTVSTNSFATFSVPGAGPHVITLIAN